LGFLKIGSNCWEIAWRRNFEKFGTGKWQFLRFIQARGYIQIKNLQNS
jgi:hypothetical protein